MSNLTIPERVVAFILAVGELADPPRSDTLEGVIDELDYAKELAELRRDAVRLRLDMNL